MPCQEPTSTRTHGVSIELHVSGEQMSDNPYSLETLAERFNVSSDKLKIACDIAGGRDYTGYVRVQWDNGEMVYTPITNKEFYKDET